MKSKITLFLLTLVWMSCRNDERPFDATGTFEADEVIVSSQVTGTIEQLNITEGTAVKAGELLGWIDSAQLHLRKKQLLAQIEAILAKRPQIATQLASLQVQLETAQRELKRMENLRKAEAATEKQVDDARAQVSVIQRQMEAHRSSLDISSQGLISETLPLYAQVEQIDVQLQQCRIVSPLSGVILNEYAQAHELATPGKPLYKVADLSNLELRAYITGSQLAQAKLDQKVTVYADDGAGGYREYPGSITWISPKAEFTPKTIQTKEERADLVYAIKIRVANDGYLKIGMYGEATL